MSGVVKTFRKTTVERRRLYINYECWLQEIEKLSSFQAVISPLTSEAPLALTLAFTDPTNKKLTMFASGGVGNTDYVVQIIVGTDAGQVKRDDIGIRVTP